LWFSGPNARRVSSITCRVSRAAQELVPPVAAHVQERAAQGVVQIGLDHRLVGERRAQLQARDLEQVGHGERRRVAAPPNRRRRDPLARLRGRRTKP
jgi:hypothetical protein